LKLILKKGIVVKVVPGFFSVVLSFLFVSSSLWASTLLANASSSAKPQAFSDARRLDDQDPEEPFRFGLGFSTYGPFSSEIFPSALSALFDFSYTHSLQVFFGVSGVKTTFNYGAGAAYRATVSGDRNIGFHLGGLVNMGGDADTDLIAQMGPLFGLHVAAFQFQQLQILIDGGPMFRYRNGPDLTVGTVGARLGFSFHYFF
jgi:hypothetical protein